MEPEAAPILTPHKKPWYKTWWGIVLLVLFFPITLSVLIWKRKWNIFARIALILLLWIVVLAMASSGDTKTAYNKGFEEGKKASQQNTSTPAPTKATTSATTTQDLGLAEKPEKYVQYATEMKTIFEAQGKASSGIAAGLAKWPNLTNNDILIMAANTLILEKAYDAVVKIDAPKELESTHAKYVSAYKLLKEAMPMLRQGLDDNDEALVNQAAQKIVQASNIMDEANKEVNAFTAEVQAKLK